jgi:O-antigen/teichoic acid export membrane protein
MLQLLLRGEGLKSQLVRGAVGVGGLKLLSLPLGLAASILLARVLGPDSFGQYTFVVSMTTLLSLPIGPGLGKLISREIAKYHHGEEWGAFRGLLRRSNQWALIGSGMIVLLIAGVVGGQIQWQGDDRWTLFLVGAIMVPLLGLNAIRSSTLRGLRHVFYAQLPELLVRPALHLLFAVILLVFGFLNPITALVSLEISTFVGFLFGAWILLNCYPPEAKRVQLEFRHREWGQALLPMTLLAAVGTFNGQMGILVLGWLGTDADVATLRIAMSGSMLVALSLTIVNLVIGPHITRTFRDNNLARMQRLSRQSARAALLFSLPVAFPLILFGRPIVQVIYGEAYIGSVALPLAILAMGQLVNVIFGSVGMFLTMAGFEKDTLFGQIIALIVNVVAAIIMVPFWGATGAALAVAIGLLTWNVVLAVRFKQRLGFRPSVF